MFSVFFTQKTSSLASQRFFQKRKGKNNLRKLFGVEKIPMDTQIKIFRILSERYRNRRKRFGLRFNLIAVIYNSELT